MNRTLVRPAAVVAAPTWGRHVAATLAFAQALLRAQLARPRQLLLTLLTPLFLLLCFWVTSVGSGDSQFDILQMMFPALVGFTVIFAGQPMAMRLTAWREQRVFQRLAATPVPLGLFLVAATLAQGVVALVQALSVLLFGIVIIGLPVDGVGAALSFGVLALGALCFIAYSMVIASLAKRPDVAGNLFVFSIMPLFFLGGGFPAELLPDALQRISPWLPTTMLNELLAGLLMAGALPDGAARSLLGLLGYGIVLTALAAWRFRWE